MSIGRRTAGITLILVTIILWTSSNFLASVSYYVILDATHRRLKSGSQTLFADDTYSKPYFVTYINTVSFSVFLLFRWGHGKVKACIDPQSWSREGVSSSQRASTLDVAWVRDPGSQDGPSSRVIIDDHCRIGSGDVSECHGIARSSLDFCLLWFSANLFVALALKYSTVASCTILTSTSGLWTLLLGAFWSVETFSRKKLVAICLSISGIAFVSCADLFHDPSGTFPHKSFLEILLGDIMSLASALLYAVYTLLLKTRAGHAGGPEMLVFLGFVGVFAAILLWPGLVLVDGIGLEPLQMPRTRRVRMIVLVSAV